MLLYFASPNQDVGATGQNKTKTNVPKAASASEAAIYHAKCQTTCFMSKRTANQTSIRHETWPPCVLELRILYFASLGKSLALALNQSSTPLVQFVPKFQQRLPWAIPAHLVVHVLLHLQHASLKLPWLFIQSLAHELCGEEATHM